MDWSSFFLGAGIVFVAVAVILNSLIYKANRTINQIIKDIDKRK